MKRSRVLLPVSLLFAGSVLVSPALRAQSYGDQSQVLTVGVAQFKGIDDAVATMDGSDTYIYNGIAGTYSYYIAPLPLPEGAAIEKICLFANDTNDTDFGYVSAYLVATKLVPIDESPFTLQIPGASAMSFSNIGYGYWCSEDFSYTLRGTSDVDGDGNPDSVVHYLTLYMPAAGVGRLGFGGAQITWRRQVSESPATPTFSDVPEAHPFYAFIEAMAKSEITGGCGGGKFCPDAPLTRGQMATFLAKALGLHWAD